MPNPPQEHMINDVLCRAGMRGAAPVAGGFAPFAAFGHH